jgi:hypothetical protein
LDVESRVVDHHGGHGGRRLDHDGPHGRSHDRGLFRSDRRLFRSDRRLFRSDRGLFRSDRGLLRNYRWFFRNYRRFFRVVNRRLGAGLAAVVINGPPVIVPVLTVPLFAPGNDVTIMPGMRLQGMKVNLELHIAVRAGGVANSNSAVVVVTVVTCGSRSRGTE